MLTRPSTGFVLSLVIGTSCGWQGKWLRKHFFRIRNDLLENSGPVFVLCHPLLNSRQPLGR